MLSNTKGRLLIAITCNESLNKIWVRLCETPSIPVRIRHCLEIVSVTDVVTQKRAVSTVSIITFKLDLRIEYHFMI